LSTPGFGKHKFKTILDANNKQHRDPAAFWNLRGLDRDRSEPDRLSGADQRLQRQSQNRKAFEWAAQILAAE
jgi:hypothetical protein